MWIYVKHARSKLMININPLNSMLLRGHLYLFRNKLGKLMYNDKIQFLLFVIVATNNNNNYYIIYFLQSFKV